MSNKDKKSSHEAKGLTEEATNAKIAFEQPAVETTGKWLMSKEESNAMFDEFKMFVNGKAQEISKLHGYPNVPQLQTLLRNEIVDSVGRMSKWRKLYLDERDENDRLKGIKREVRVRVNGKGEPNSK